MPTPKASRLLAPAQLSSLGLRNDGLDNIRVGAFAIRIYRSGRVAVDRAVGNHTVSVGRSRTRRGTDVGVGSTRVRPINGTTNIVPSNAFATAGNPPQLDCVLRRRSAVPVRVATVGELEALLRALPTTRSRCWEWLCDCFVTDVNTHLPIFSGPP